MTIRVRLLEASRRDFWTIARESPLSELAATSLTPKQLDAARLYGGGLTLKQTAAALGITFQSVQDRLLHAEGRLLDALLRAS